jgi:hypothetical protein
MSMRLGLARLAPSRVDSSRAGSHRAVQSVQIPAVISSLAHRLLAWWPSHPIFAFSCSLITRLPSEPVRNRSPVIPPFSLDLRAKTVFMGGGCRSDCQQSSEKITTFFVFGSSCVVRIPRRHAPPARIRSTHISSHTFSRVGSYFTPISPGQGRYESVTSCPDEEEAPPR